MEKKKVITLLNILLVIAMVVHVGIKMYLHGQKAEYSSPVYVELTNAAYYLIPEYSAQDCAPQPLRLSSHSGGIEHARRWR